MEQYYLIGVLSDESSVRPKWAGWLVCYSATDQTVALVEGLRPYDHGSIKSLAAWLQYRPTKAWRYGYDSGIERESPGWFERILTVSGCGWFLAPALRITAGERVPLEEITAAYAAANQGRPMPCGTLEALFAYAKQHGLVK